MIALDILRTLVCEPLAVEGYWDEVGAARGGNVDLDAAANKLFAELAHGAPVEARGRALAEQMALVLQGALLVRNAPMVVADAFCATRLGEEGARSFGVLPTGTNLGAILDRQTMCI